MATIRASERSSATALQGEVEQLIGHARDLIEASRTESTLRAYASDWADFESFCRRLALGVLPADPATVGLYIAEMAAVRQLAASTIGRRMAAISVLHVEAGHPSPTAHPQVRRLMTGTRRTLGVQQHAKRALTPTELRRMIAALGDDLASQRDRAMMLVGFVGGLRRSELVAINVGDLKVTEDGYVLTVRRSKTDQEARTRRVALPYSADPLLCPVRSVLGWLRAGEIDRGAVFRRIRRGGHVTGDRITAQTVGLTVKKLATLAKVPRPDELGGHSLRSGFATAAAAAGASERSIANQTGHKSMQVLRRYIAQATTFDDNAATDLGL